MLASEESYKNGLLHGICRQFDATGRLLGQYQMVAGTPDVKDYAGTASMLTRLASRWKEWVVANIGTNCAHIFPWLTQAVIVTRLFVPKFKGGKSTAESTVNAVVCTAVLVLANPG
jgi:antitoxin component YwqK of YwqJK toxin-antitoxin module